MSRDILLMMILMEILKVVNVEMVYLLQYKAIEFKL